jgi:hypothetical protein
VLRFAEREREAGLLQRVAERAEEPSARVLFRELGAEHVHWETLLHIEPADVVDDRAPDAERLADRLLRVASPARPPLGGLAVAPGVTSLGGSEEKRPPSSDRLPVKKKPTRRDSERFSRICPPRSEVELELERRQRGISCSRLWRPAVDACASVEVETCGEWRGWWLWRLWEADSPSWRIAVAPKVSSRTAM